MHHALETPKLLSLAEAVAARAALRRAGKRAVLTNGVFDLLHPGHLYSLAAARRLGDALFVAINSDASVRALKGPTRPILSEAQRAYALAALECVDAVLVFDSERLTEEIRALAPDVYAKAGDYTLETLNSQERAELERCGAQISFLPFLPGFSTTTLIEKIRAAGEA
ncbi:ADP-heptose synthase [Cephaloticoccus primus]|uniref:ADP-heptose synthase n=1 Tax=Cephaloticoccus primus TaxID=1548207 RepID=A0A139SHQ5_9BACT|nr:adenylyltransferase/cytidyltransferase family protein [Cephaloticoccus primus]KXU34051.1 ADP-heptose synthase [Cephaloticoccus primus]